MGVKKYEKRGKSLWKVDTWLTLADGSVKRFKKAGIPTKEMATALEQKVRVEAFEGRYFDRRRAKPFTVADAWKAYEPISRRDHRDPRSAVARARHLLRHLGSRQVAGLTLRDVDVYRERRRRENTGRGGPPKVATVNREVGLLRHLANHAVKAGDLDRNPLVGVRMLDEDNIREVVIDEAGFGRLHECAEGSLKGILLLAFDTGMRKREILDLRWAQVDLKERTVRLGARDTKTRKARVVVLTERACAMLGELPRSIKGADFVFPNPRTGRPWNQIRKVFDRARQAAGLPGVWFHDLRRSFVTNARRRGVPESVVMRLSGHRTRSVFDRYNVVSEDDLREAVRAIETGSRAELARDAAAGEGSK